MGARRLATAVLALACLAALIGPSSAGAWQYTFKNFIKVGAGGYGGGITQAKRCAPTKLGEWRFSSQIETEIETSYAPDPQDFELLIKAKMPITAKYKHLREVDVSWRAELPKDPEIAKLLTNFYNDLANSQADFYEGMRVRLHPTKPKRLQIRHQGLTMNGYQSLPPGEAITAFNPKSGC